MNEAALFADFKGKWCERGGLYLVAKSSAADFVAFIVSRRIPLLGIDGFIVDESRSAESPIAAASAAFAHPRSPGDEAARYFEAMRSANPRITHFEFVLDLK